MCIELSAGEPFAASVQRAARAGLDQVQAVLAGGEAGAQPAPAAVHIARKELKKLRALLRLARAGIGENVFGPENICYRDTGRALSAARDAAVLVDAFDALRPELYGLIAPETITSVHDRLLGTVRVNEANLDLPGAIQVVQAARARVDDWPWLHAPDAWRVPGQGLRRVYRRGRRAMRQAAVTEPFEEDFHEWRKQIKLLAAQLRLLRPIHPTEIERTAKALEQVAAWLGEEHDLSVLGDTLFGGPAGHLEATAELETVRRLLDARRRHLQRKAVKHGQRLFKEKPRHYAAQLKAHWKRWRKNHR